MNCKFPEGSKCAQYDVKDHPSERQPACPVAATEHKCTCQDCQSFGEFNRNAIRLPQIMKMVPTADNPNREKKAGDDNDWHRTPNRVHSSTSAAI